MGIVRRKLSDLPPPTQEQKAWRDAYAKDPKGGLDYPYLAGWTAEERARSTRSSDYPTPKDADNEAEHLADLQAAGMGVKELEEYKQSRIKQLATV